MINLRDCMQADFDKTTLAKESDVSLTKFQARVEAAVTDWKKLSRELEEREQAWLEKLTSLLDYVSSLMGTRYGCND